ncbi:uncharacterized protein BXZ73DRAFT_51798 [Epithele typhae]|uniref:uncharacterized protein n=1 Tax=Epithele typhae TaxID=378194 RepID=UPI002007DB8D|nr:uncharacterized protein BXZ73DRAFT_51798 [Epithele typhae]KAH9921556.1 hypothetical protein BXZ73DRAFT_51798 [Epithele typhae]
MLVFTSPEVANRGFELSLARHARKPNTFLVVFSRAYGMASSRTYAVLNVSTPAAAPASLSPQGRPLIWLDSDLDRDPRNLGPSKGVLAALLAAEPPVVRATGRTQRMHAAEGGERDAHEVEVLLAGDQLARCCWYCGASELNDDVREGRRFERCPGSADGAESSYRCPTCAEKPALSRWISSLLSPPA